MSTESSTPDQSPESPDATDSNESETTQNTSQSQPLTIALPDGSESVSDAIVTHREMLLEPDNHGLATAEDISHLTEAMESYSGNLDEITTGIDENASEVTQLKEVIEKQNEQITELQSMVSSLAEILGTEAEWNTFD